MVKSVTPAGRESEHRGRRRIARLAALALSIPLAVGLVWAVVHRVPGIGPWGADLLRSAIGVERVARLEDSVYAVEDTFNRYWHRGDRPQARWSVPETQAASLRPQSRALPLKKAEQATVDPRNVPVPASPPLPESPLPPHSKFHPLDVGPMLKSWSAPGDGQWLPLPTSSGGEATRPLLFKTLLHPDPRRSWAELFVVAVDLRAVRVQLVAGSEEPQATETGALAMDRPGVVPRSHVAAALGAFNGGFKTEHGHYGMKVGALTLIPANEGACTVLEKQDGSLAIGSWARVESFMASAGWWRQTPNCMYEQGVIHPRLAEGFVHQWGATLSGQTVIRRSAIGVDATGQTLFVAISNHTTAPALARGMHHAGAETVAQLDVNHSYPKFVTFHESDRSALRFAVPLADGFEYSEQEYLTKPSRRDFFYLMPRQVRTAQQ